MVSLVAAGLVLGGVWLLLLANWSQKTSTIKQICLTASSVAERQLSPFKDTSLLPRIQRNVTKKYLASGDLREWPIYKDALRSWKRRVTIRAGSLKVTCKLLGSTGCGRTMVWVSRGRIHVIVLLLLFQADDWVCLWFNDSTLSPCLNGSLLYRPSAHGIKVKGRKKFISLSFPLLLPCFPEDSTCTNRTLELGKTLKPSRD